MKQSRNDWLKVIAMASMLIDHIGLLFFPEEALFRQIGRLAFPLYAYFLAQGFSHTRSRPRYYSRLLLFGLISQVPFVWLNQGAQMDLWQVNQVPMLLYAGLVLLVLEQAKKAGNHGLKALLIAASLALSLVPEWLMYIYPKLSLPYGAYGILLSLLFYWFSGQMVAQTVGFIALSWFYPYRYFAQWAGPGSSFFDSWTNFSGIYRYYHMTAPAWLSFSQTWSQNNALFALPVIYLGQQMSSRLRLNKWLMYWFYPGHIGLLVGLYHIFMK